MFRVDCKFVRISTSNYCMIVIAINNKFDEWYVIKEVS